MKHLVSTILIIVTFSLASSQANASSFFDKIFGNSSSTTKTDTYDAEEVSDKSEISQEYVELYGYDMLDILDNVSKDDEGERRFKIVSKAEDFIDQHCDLFMGTDKDRSESVSYIDANITYSQVSKNDDKYGDKYLFLQDIYLNQIYEWEYDSDGNMLTKLYFIDDDYNYYVAYYYGELPYYEDTRVDAILLPVASSSYSNTSGGKTLCLYCAASIVSDPYSISISDSSLNTDSYSYDTNYYSNIDTYNEYDEYMVWGTDSGYFSKEYFEQLSDYELRIARNEILARHGRAFKDEELQEYFNNKSWYTPIYSPEEFDSNMESMLNGWEKANIEVIKEVEAERANYAESTYVEVSAPDGYVNLRSGPGTEYDIILPISNGELLEIINNGYTSDGKWINVAYWYDGWYEGWVASSQVN